MKRSTAVLIAIPVIFVFWVIGLFNGMYLIPGFEEDYYVEELGLSHPMTLLEPEEQLSLQLPHDSDSLKAIDLMIYSFDEPSEEQKDHKVTIRNMSIDVITEDGRLPATYNYLYAEEGELPGLQAIVDYSITSYIDLRSVYNLHNINDFKVQVTADYLYDNKPRNFSKTFDVEHKSKFKWNRLRVFEPAKY